MKNKTPHQLTCAWERSTCEYKATHHYCPHPEHACTCSPVAPERKAWDIFVDKFNAKYPTTRLYATEGERFYVERAVRFLLAGSIYEEYARISEGDGQALAQELNTRLLEAIHLNATLVDENRILHAAQSPAVSEPEDESSNDLAARIIEVNKHPLMESLAEAMRLNLQVGRECPNRQEPVGWCDGECPAGKVSEALHRFRKQLRASIENAEAAGTKEL